MDQTKAQFVTQHPNKRVLAKNGIIEDDEAIDCYINTDEKANLVEDEDSLPSKVRWRYIYIMYFTTFTQYVAYSFTFASLWPFLRELDKSINETFLGLVYAGRSLAELIAGVGFGYWCDYRKPIEPLVLSMVLFFLGHLLYGLAEGMGSYGIWAIVASRLLAGASAGSNAVSRTEVTRFAKSHEITKAMSYLSLCELVGLVIGPVIQTAFTYLGPNGFYFPHTQFKFNMYSAPAYFMIIFNILNVFLLASSYHQNSTRGKDTQMDDKSESRPVFKDPVDKIAVFVTLSIHFLIMLDFVQVETIFAPILMNIYALRREQTVLYGGILTISSSCLGFIGVFFVPRLTKILSDRQIMIGSLIIYVIDYIILLPYGPGKLQLRPPDIRYPNGTIVLPLNGGCPYEYEWCHYTPQLSFIQFLVGVFAASIFAPIGFAISTVIFAKIIASFNQGVYMGWFTGVEALTKIICPLYATLLYRHFGIYGTSGVTCLLNLIGILVFGVAWKHMVAFDDRPKQLSE